MHRIQTGALHKSSSSLHSPLFKSLLQGLRQAVAAVAPLCRGGQCWEEFWYLADAAASVSLPSGCAKAAKAAMVAMARPLSPTGQRMHIHLVAMDIQVQATHLMPHKCRRKRLNTIPIGKEERLSLSPFMESWYKEALSVNHNWRAPAQHLVLLVAS